MTDPKSARPEAKPTPTTRSSTTPATAPPAGRPAAEAAPPPGRTAPAAAGTPGRIALLTLGLLVAILALSYLIYDLEALSRLPAVVGWLVQPILAIALVLVGIAWIHKLPFGAGLAELGLWAPIGPAFLFGLFATLPMAIWLGLSDAPLRDLDPLTLLFTLLVWPLVEEILFIGFAFRRLYRYAGWGFLSAALVGPVIFALLHVGNSFFADVELGKPLFAAGLAIVGGLLFAWLFVAWADNLWVPIIFHGMMNFWWEGFGLDRAGVGIVGSDVVRLLAVALAVAITIWRHRLPFGLKPARVWPGRATGATTRAA